MPGSCRSGFRSAPSGAGGKRRANGSDVIRMKRRKPTETRPRTEITRAWVISGIERAEKATAQVHQLRHTTQKRMEPSCDPHVAASL
jgi:hypothetical protein